MNTGENQGQPSPMSNDKNETLFAMLCHLTALSGFLGVPFGHILGPLVIWLLKREEHPLIDEQGKEALNFQISMTIYTLIACILILIVIGFLLLIVLAVADVVLIIIAAVKVHNGESYRYPWTIRFIK